MNVLVTGGAGYIGYICVEELINSGHKVTVLDNLSEGHRSAVDPRAKFIEGNLGDPATANRAIKEAQAEAIIHFAAHALVGESKLMFEKMLLWYQQIFGLEFVAFRYFNAAGASGKYGEHHRIETHLIPNVLKVPLGQATQCEIYGTDYPTPDGTCIRDYIHIVDLAQAHILAMQPGKQGFFNLGNGEGYSVREVIKMCEKVSGKSIPAIEKPRRPGDPPRLVAGAQKAFTELGWKPKYAKLEDIVSTAWAWHKAHPNGYAD